MATLGLVLLVFAGNGLVLASSMHPFWADAAPHLTLLGAIYIGFMARAPAALSLAILLGFFQDCMGSAWPLGHYAFLYGTAAYLAHRLRRYLPPEAAIAQFLAALLAGLGTAFVSLLLVVATVRSSPGPGLGVELLRACTGAACAPALFAVLESSRLFRRALGRRSYQFA